ncbi:Alcohol dehydrogenase transcription factor Myb/SANT-like [Popillia japonica]|uniref:Alcohol dehydrogenase transcription factor Myb/SANT-like n=1 Tax=Popillia japonica TaxID=7064 RepID=A0AAW1M9R2_POPJA
MSWSHEQVEELIELYKARPCLYAIKTPQYKNRHARTKALEEIETALKNIRRNTTVAEIKAKINTLRSNFLAEVRKIKNIKSGAGEDEVYTTTLWYFDLMYFILEHTAPRGTEDSISDAVMSSSSGNTAVSEVNEDSISETQFYLNEESGDLIEINQSSETLIMPENSLDSAIKNTPSSSKQFSGKRKRKCDDDDDAILYDVTQSISSISQTVASLPTKEAKSKDAVDVFCEFVGSRLRICWK